MRRTRLVAAIGAVVLVALALIAAPPVTGAARMAAHALIGTPVPATATTSPVPATATSTAITTPTATPVPAAVPGVALPPVYYQDGAGVYAQYPDGSRRVLVVTLPANYQNLAQASLLADGRLLYPVADGIFVVDSHDRAAPLRVPDHSADEQVQSAILSPDGRTLAWQLFSPATVNAGTSDQYEVNTGNSRIVLTNRFGDPGTTVFTAAASGRDGEVPTLLGWRPSSPYGYGGPTLLLQDLYSNNDVTASLVAGAMRGLLEYDPTIRDVVNDYLPPLDSSVPPQRAFAISTDGVWAIYGDSNNLTPSGEGPLAQTIEALDLNTNKLYTLDRASNYPTTGSYTVTTQHKEGKRTVITKVKKSLHLYQYFSHHAYIAPGNAHVLYTGMTVSYPPGARAPRVQRRALVVTLDGFGRHMIAADGEAQGWLDAHTAVVKRGATLYAVNIDTGATTTLVAGRDAASLRFIGVRKS